jgi:CBS domain-containing protein
VRKNISGAPVVDTKGKLLGLVLEESLIFQDKKVHLPTVVAVLNGFLTFGEEKYEQEMNKIVARTAEGIMDENPLVLSPRVDITDAATLVVEKNIHYFPVVEAGKLVGVVTKRDIVKAIAKGKI